MFVIVNVNGCLCETLSLSPWNISHLSCSSHSLFLFLIFWDPFALIFLRLEVYLVARYESLILKVTWLLQNIWQYWLLYQQFITQVYKPTNYWNVGEETFNRRCYLGHYINLFVFEKIGIIYYDFSQIWSLLQLVRGVISVKCSSNILFETLNFVENHDSFLFLEQWNLD